VLVYAPVSEVEVTAADGNFKKEVRLAAVKREGKLTSRQKRCGFSLPHVRRHLLHNKVILTLACYSQFVKVEHAIFRLSCPHLQEEARPAVLCRPRPPSVLANPNRNPG
jgi:hypothetical protein